MRALWSRSLDRWGCRTRGCQLEEDLLSTVEYQAIEQTSGFAENAMIYRITSKAVDKRYTARWAQGEGVALSHLAIWDYLVLHEKISTGIRLGYGYKNTGIRFRSYGTLTLMHCNHHLPGLRVYFRNSSSYVFHAKQSIHLLFCPWLQDISPCHVYQHSLLSGTLCLR